MIHNNVLEAVGETPIIRLQRLPDRDSAEVLVKFEGLNVGGSIKTRTALNMIEEAERLKEVSQNQSYELIRECQSQIERIKYGENLSEFKRQWTERLEIVKAELKKRG